MAIQQGPSAFDPWDGECREEIEGPDWEPLARLAVDDRLSDQDGNTYQYVDSEYVPIPTSTALRRCVRWEAGPVSAG